MMKHLIISLLALCCFIDTQAQKVTRSYDNVTMSEALRDLNELSSDYTISLPSSTARLTCSNMFNFSMTSCRLSS